MVTCVDDGASLVLLDTAANERERDFIGEVVDGRYRVERLVGRGGMGTVYACRHVVVGKCFAMKVLRSGIERSEEILQRFIREAQAANSIRSRHICEMSDFGQMPGGAFYVVMELLEGTSLTRALREQRLTRQDLKHVFIQIADTLQKAHDASIVHRDLKPDNVVLVNDEGDPFFVKLVDFGIAKMLETRATNLTDTGVILGTPYYMSPEQARGDAIDHRSDIYSLGVMMYRAFTGKLPFMADTAMGVLTRHLTQAPEAPSRIAEIEPAVEKIILRCMEKRPSDRFFSMNAVAAALEAMAGPAPPIVDVDTTVDEPTPGRVPPRDMDSPMHEDDRPRFTPTRLATPRAIADGVSATSAEAWPQRVRSEGAADEGASQRPSMPPAPARPSIPPALAQPNVRPARRPSMPPALDHSPAIPAPLPVPGALLGAPRIGSAIPHGPAEHPFPSVAPPAVGTYPHAHGLGGFDAGVPRATESPHGFPGQFAPNYLVHHGGVAPAEALPPHLLGESNTNRGLVSSRMTVRPPAAARRATATVAGALFVLVAIAVGAVATLVERKSADAPTSAARENAPTLPTSAAGADAQPDADSAELAPSTTAESPANTANTAESPSEPQGVAEPKTSTGARAPLGKVRPADARPDGAPQGASQGKSAATATPHGDGARSPAAGDGAKGGDEPPPRTPLDGIRSPF